MDNNTVSAKLPAFWADNVETWFSQVEAEFSLRNITVDQTKYSHVLAVLGNEAAAAAEQLINNPPQTEKYAALKEFLLDAFGLSESERAERLLAIEDLGTRKPSQLMNRILHLYGNHEHNFLIRHIFMRALPENLRQSLASCTEENLRKLAKEADRQAPMVKRQAYHADSHAIDAARQSVVRSRTLCYYHFKFGARAKKCQQPCAWRQGNGQTSSQ